MDLAPYAVAIAMVLVAAIQTRALTVQGRRARAAKHRADALGAEHKERRELVNGWRKLVDASQAQWEAINALLTTVRDELAQCERDRSQFIVDLATLEARLERHEAVLAGRIPPPH